MPDEPEIDLSALTEAERGRLSFLLGRYPDFESYCRATLPWDLHEWQRWVCRRLGRLHEEEGARILIHGPPQYGKSIVTSMRLPSWLLGMDPDRKIALATNSIATSETMGDATRGVMSGADYKRMFPRTRLHEKGTAGSFRTTARARRSDGTHSFIGLGLQSGWPGKGLERGDLLIVDDPYVSMDEAKSQIVNEKVWRWWQQSAMVRVDSGANIVMFYHRYHDDDLAGRVIRSGGWEYYRFPAIADSEGDDPTGRAPGELLSPRRTREWLDAKLEDDPYTFVAMFQGLPRNPAGEFFQESWFSRREPMAPRFDRVVRFWDLAVAARQRSDFTAGALCGIDAAQNLWILDVVRFKHEWPEASRRIAEIAQRDRADWGESAVGVEEVYWQLPMIQDLQRMGVFQGVPLWPIKPKGKKKERASGWAARAENGQVVLQAGAWNEPFVSECLAFTGLDGAPGHDDMVDAVSGAYALLWRLRGGYTEERKPEDELMRAVEPGSFEHLARRNGWRYPGDDDFGALLGLDVAALAGAEAED